MYESKFLYGSVQGGAGVDVFELIVEHAPAAFSVQDLAGNYRWVSDGFVGVLGYTPEHLVGRSAYELIHPDDHAAGQAGHQRLFDQDGPVVVRCRLRAADGTYRWVETTSRLVRDEQVIVSTSHWVDGQRSAVETLQTERDLAGRFQRIDEQHRHFLTAISHRARQPVTIIRGMAELLHTRAQHMKPEQQAQLVERIAGNATRLAELIEDVTQAERLTRRTDRVQVRPLDLHDLVRQCLADLADNDAPITVTVPPDMVVFGDHDMLRLALKTLLENAIDHTPIDTPIWIASQQVHDGTVIIVKDAGPGVPSVLREEIFAPFHRGDPDSADPGLGLGLHTVAEIAAVHGGRTWVEDRDGGGAAFHLLLPTAAAQTIVEQRSDPARRRPAPTADAPTAGGQRRDLAAPAIRLLVVDDEEMITELMGMTLAAEGFDVDAAHDGTEALQLITDAPPDLLICDVRMPGLNGRQLVRTIRDMPDIANLPVILCSALSDDENQWQSWRSGADSFIAKPFSPDHLVAEVCRLLVERGSTRPEASPSDLPSAQQRRT